MYSLIACAVSIVGQRACHGYKGSQSLRIVCELHPISCVVPTAHREPSTPNTLDTFDDATKLRRQCGVRALEADCRASRTWHFTCLERMWPPLLWSTRPLQSTSYAIPVPGYILEGVSLFAGAVVLEHGDSHDPPAFVLTCSRGVLR